MSEILWLRNVLLEMGIENFEDGSIETQTGSIDLKIQEGIIVEKQSHPYAIPSNEKVLDAKGLLAVPNFKEMHNHLDKKRTPNHKRKRNNI